MSDLQLYNAMKALAGVLMIASACIAVASNLPDLGLSKQSVAILTVVQAGIAATLSLLPQLQRPALNKRGDSTDN